MTAVQEVISSILEEKVTLLNVPTVELDAKNALMVVVVLRLMMDITLITAVPYQFQKFARTLY